MRSFVQNISFFVLLCFVCCCSAFPKFETESQRNDFVFPGNQKATKPSLRIVGGTQATAHQFPYQVGMYVTSNTGAYTFCGGSLVSTNYVLTAAHCAMNSKEIQVILGAQDVTKNEADQVKFTTSNYTIHTGWDSKTLVNDIALVALPQSVNISDKIRCVKLASGNHSFAGDNGTVSGWGHTYDSQSTITSNLFYLTNQIMSNTNCQAASQSYAKIIKETHVCLSGDGERSVCNGDSGGPLVDNGVQVGIVSFGWKSCEQSMPSVFTRVSEYADWIQQNSDVIIS